MKESNPYFAHLDNPIHHFFLQQLLETGLPLELNSFPYQVEGKTFNASYMTPDSNGNVRFYVPDIITGGLEQYTFGQVPHLKIRDWYLTRWQKMIETTEGLAKYTPVKNGGTRCLFTKPVTDAFNQKTQIKTLFVVEGFKKAISAAVNAGLPIVGMNGLFGFKDPEETQTRLRKEIRQVLSVCKVQRVVVIFDSDLFDLGSSKDKAESTRPNQFYRAVITAKLLFEPFCDVYLSFPNPHPVRKYGLDDLLLEHRNFSLINSPWKCPDETKLQPFKIIDGQKKVIKDLLESIDKNNSGKFFTSWKLSSFTDFKIKELFHLDNVQNFYEFYRQKLLKKDNKRFRFFTHLYQIQGDNTIIEVEAENTRSLNIESRFGKLVRMTDKGPKELANFTMRVLFQIDSEEDPKRIVEIRNYEGITRQVEITSKTFVSLSDFQALMITYGDFIWKGTKEDLLDVMTILFKHEKPATLISQYGWQPVDRFYAFSNGIVTAQGFMPVDEYGMVVHNDINYYFPAWSKFNVRNYDAYKDDKKFSHILAKNPPTFRKWKDQFVKVYREPGTIAIAFFIATLFSDIVFSHKSGLGFPLLWSAGKPKTGKSTICTSLLSMFGQPSDAIGLGGKSTIKYFISRFAQIRNAYIMLDEYSNTKVTKDVKETLKNLYDRIGYGRKVFSNDFRTTVTPILSAALVAGEEIPTDNHALFTRAILLLFNKDKFTVAERNEFLVLRDMEEAGLTHITIDILRHRQLIEDNFDDTYNFVFTQFYDHFKTKKIDDRMLKNSAWILTPVKILLDAEKLDYGESFNSILTTFFNNIERQYQYMDANTDVAKFWDIIESLISQKIISEDKGDFKFVDDLVAIRLSRFHIPYALEARKLGYEKILDKSTLANYLINEPYYVERLRENGTPVQLRFNGSAPIPCMFFDYKSIEIDMKGANHPESESEPDDLQRVKELNAANSQMPESLLDEEEKKDLPF